MAAVALHAQAAAPRTPTLQLSQAEPVVAAELAGHVWVDPQGTATLQQMLLSSGPRFEPARPDVIHSLGEHGALWMHFRLVRADRVRWLLAFPMPALDTVTVWQQDAAGQWLAQTAGDTLAVSTWPEPGRYPHFRLEMPVGQPRDIYVRIRHLTSADFPMLLLTEGAYDQRIQLGYLGLGLTFGALLLLISACVAQSLVYRDSIYAWYALYASVTALAVAAYTGVAAHLLWPGFGLLGDAPQGSLAILFAASALLFVRSLAGISGRHAHIDRAVYVAGFAGIGMALLFPFISRPVGLSIMAAYLAATTLTNTWIAFTAWRRGDVVGMWVLAAYFPLCIALGMTLARLVGWLPVSFGTQYAIVVAMTIKLPLLLVALNIRSRERHGAQIREQALSSQDALTGLLAPHLFNDRLRQVVARYRRDRENAAVVFIDLVNYPRIKEHFGTAVAEQSLLRCVIKLRRLLRDVDTVSRIGEARFGLILEGVTSRIAVTDRAARLIAAGLMPLQGLKPDVTLQFHIAAVLLEERITEPHDLVHELSELLGGMSPRTRRPIRFLEPINTEPVPLGSDSSLLDSDSVLPETGGSGRVSRISRRR
ncbi:MAG: 7TM diverse intracellular signaling domain-containing protein [Ramlibacter sp.]